MNRKKTLVFGASLKPERYSNMVIHSLVKNQQEVVAFGLRKGIVAGIEIKTSLIPHSDIDTITLYLNAERQRAYYDYLISLSPKRVIFNPGTYNAEFIELLQKNNIEADAACTLVLLGTNQY
ncbi:MAG: CoA-binding protein [Gilvibacter sp.]